MVASEKNSNMVTISVNSTTSFNSLKRVEISYRELGEQMKRKNLKTLLSLHAEIREKSHPLGSKELGKDCRVKKYFLREGEKGEKERFHFERKQIGRRVVFKERGFPQPILGRGGCPRPPKEDERQRGREGRTRKTRSLL